MKLVDKKLVGQTIEYVKNEKKFTIMILKNLQQIYAEKIYLDYNCSSLFCFCTKILNYGDSEAAIRVNAMKLLAQNQEVDKKIINGELTLTAAATIQSFFQSESEDEERMFTTEERGKLIDELSGKSTRELKAELDGKKKNPKPKQYQVMLDEEAYQKFIQLSKEMGDSSPSSVIKKVCLEREEKAKADLEKVKEKAAQEEDKAALAVRNTRYIPAAVKRSVMARANGQCEHRSQETGERCQCKNQLTFDHCFPFAVGGKSEVENLRLLCSQHNARYSIKFYGINKASDWIDRSKITFAPE